MDDAESDKLSWQERVAKVDKEMAERRREEDAYQEALDWEAAQDMKSMEDKKEKLLADIFDYLTNVGSHIPSITAASQRTSAAVASLRFPIWLIVILLVANLFK